MALLTIDAVPEKLPEVQAFVEGQLEAMECPMKVMLQISVAVEEIFVNIACYGYPEHQGQAQIEVALQPAPRAVRITFTDSGIPFDPLAKPDPDVTLSAGERGIGGLGIYMVKKTMDDVSYERKDGQNVLSILRVF